MDDYYDQVGANFSLTRCGDEADVDEERCLRHLYGLHRRAEELDVPFALKTSDLYYPRCCPIFPEFKLRFNHVANFNSFAGVRVVIDRGFVAGNVVITSLFGATLRSDTTSDEKRKIAANWRRLLIERGFPPEGTAHPGA